MLANSFARNSAAKTVPLSRLPRHDNTPITSVHMKPAVPNSRFMRMPCDLLYACLILSFVGCFDYSPVVVFSAKSPDKQWSVVVKCVREGDYLATAVLEDSKGKEVARSKIGRFDTVDDARAAVAGSNISNDTVVICGSSNKPIIQWHLSSFFQRSE